MAEYGREEAAGSIHTTIHGGIHTHVGFLWEEPAGGIMTPQVSITVRVGASSHVIRNASSPC